MKTSSFYLYSGTGRISIARAAPRRVAAGFKVYRALAPGAWLFDPKYGEDHDAYRERYFREILAPLEPQQVWDDLHALPQTIRQEEIYILLGEIIAHLAKLKRDYGLNKVDSPVAYLDEHIVNWRDDFPLPIESEAGHRFIDELLSEVSKLTPPAA